MARYMTYRDMARPNTGSASGANFHGTAAANKMYKCSVCKKDKPTAQYSNKQQLRLRTNNGICKDCNGGPSMELQCAFCGVYKVRDQFSKSQLRNNNRDNAKCIPCQENKNQIEPDEIYKDSDDDSDYSNPTNAYESEDEDDSTSNGVSLANFSSSKAPGSAGQSSGIRAPDGWVQQYRPGNSGSTQRSAVSTFNHSGYGRSKPGPSSVAGSSFSTQTVKKSTGGWAKPPKGPDESAASLPDDDSEERDDWSKANHESSDDDSDSDHRY